MHAYSPPVPALAKPGPRRRAAVIYCEGNFGRIDGKTANGLVRSSERYRIVAVIDSTRAGSDAGVALGGEAIGIPVVASLDEAFAAAGRHPGGIASAPGTLEVLLFGLAPLSGLMSAVVLSSACSMRPWSAAPAVTQCLPVSLPSTIRNATFASVSRIAQLFLAKGIFCASSSRTGISRKPWRNRGSQLPSWLLSKGSAWTVRLVLQPPGSSS